MRSKGCLPHNLRSDRIKTMKMRTHYIYWMIIATILFVLPLWATNQQDDGRSFFNVNQGSFNEIGSGYGSSGTSTPFNEDGTGFYRAEFPVGAITNSVYTDDGIWYELGGLGLSASIVTPDLDVGGDTGTIQIELGTDTLNIVGGTGISTGAAGSTLTITNDSPNVDQNLYETIAGDSGSRAATSPTDTLTIAGGTGISTIMAGTTLTVTNDSPNVEQDIWYEISDDDGTAFPPTDPEMHLSFVTTEGITIDGSSGVPNTTQFTIGLDPEITIGDSSNTGSIVIHDGNGETQTITVTNQAGNINFVLPDTDGDSGDFLTTDGGGNTSWGVPTDTDTNTWMLTAPLEDGRTIQAGSATPTPITHPLTITDNGTITEYGVYIAAWIESPLGVDTLTVGLYVNGSLVDSFTSTAGNAADGTYLFTTCSEAVTAWQNIELKIDVDDNDAVLAGAWVAEGTP